MESRFSFLDYAWEIYEAAKSNGVPTDIGFDMFRKDVENGYNANCGPDLADFNFPAAKHKWDRLTDGEQNAARGAWRTFAGRAYLELSNAFTAGDRDAFGAAVAEHGEQG